MRDLLLSLSAKRSRTCLPQERSQQEGPLGSPEIGQSYQCVVDQLNLQSPSRILASSRARDWCKCRHFCCQRRSFSAETWFSSHFAEVFLRFTARETSYGDAWRASLDHFMAALLPHFQVQSTLNDAEQVLLFRVFMCCDASVEPSDGTFHGFFHAYMIW